MDVIWYFHILLGLNYGFFSCWNTKTSQDVPYKTPGVWEHQILDFAYWCSCFGLWSIGATPSSFPKVHPPSWIWLFPEGQSKGWEAAAGYCQTMMVSHHCCSLKHPAANAVAVPQNRVDHIHQNPSLQHPKYKLDRVPPLVPDPPQPTPSLEDERRRNLFATLHF